jgi:hypothetical protein
MITVSSVKLERNSKTTLDGMAMFPGEITFAEIVDMTA